MRGCLFFFISANGVSPWSISTVGLVLIITSFTVLGIVLLGIGLRLTRLSNAFDKGKELDSVKPTILNTSLGLLNLITDKIVTLCHVTSGNPKGFGVLRSISGILIV